MAVDVKNEPRLSAKSMSAKMLTLRGYALKYAVCNGLQVAVPERTGPALNIRERITFRKAPKRRCTYWED